MKYVYITEEEGLIKRNLTEVQEALCTGEEIRKVGKKGEFSIYKIENKGRDSYHQKKNRKAEKKSKRQEIRLSDAIASADLKRKATKVQYLLEKGAIVGVSLRKKKGKGRVRLNIEALKQLDAWVEEGVGVERLVRTKGLHYRGQSAHVEYSIK